MLRVILTIIQVFASAAIIALVLLQRGKGADGGAGFGAGASGTVFGARGARTALSRATAIFAAVFMVNSLALAYMGTRAGGGASRRRFSIDEAAESTVRPRRRRRACRLLARWRLHRLLAPARWEAPQSGAPAQAPSTPSPTPQQ